MRKQKKLYLWLGVLLLGCMGCSIESNQESTTPTITSTPIPTIKKEPTTSAMFQRGEEMITPQPSPSLKKQERKTEGLCEALEKTENVLVGYNSLNRMLSTMDMNRLFFGESYFCVDESRGVSYFVNQGKDYYLYRIKEGEVALAVAMPVKELCVYQDSIYFMIHDYEKYELQEMKSGDIYCYTPASGTVELVYAAGNIENSVQHRLEVEESGIYFSYRLGTEAKIYSYYLPFGGTEPVKDTKAMVTKGWKDYIFWQDNFNLGLASRIVKDGTRERLELPPMDTINFCVVGDFLYSANHTSISCFNLETKEEFVYDFSKVIEKQEENLIKDGFQVIQSFTLTKDAIWLTTGGYVYCMDLKSGEIHSGSIMGVEKEKYCNITILYTDGKEVYGLDTPKVASKEGASVVRLLTEQMDGLGKAEIIAEFLTE